MWEFPRPRIEMKAYALRRRDYRAQERPLEGAVKNKLFDRGPEQ